MSQDELVENGRDAIEAIFGDTRVSMEQTRDDLEELRSDIDMKLSAVNQDIDRAHEERNR